MTQTILFQGDSITDALRNREDDHYAGHGYATMVKGRLGLEHPGRYAFINRGVSGNRVVDLYARIKADFINLKPDVVSILIGVNDVWHEFTRCNGVDAAKFEKVYDLLLCELLESLPGVTLLLLEPFAMPGENTRVTEGAADGWQSFYDEVRLRADAVERLARKHSLPFVPLQRLFERASKDVEPSYWLYDGVHPTAMGHELIAREWLKAFDSASNPS